MLIIETPIFTKRVKALLSDEEYRLLQNELVARPDAGKIIPESGGLRKIRWSGSGRGKRGGTRLIYYWASSSLPYINFTTHPLPLPGGEFWFAAALRDLPLLGGARSG